jgi:hypothetical protein
MSSALSDAGRCSESWIEGCIQGTQVSWCHGQVECVCIAPKRRYSQLQSPCRGQHAKTEMSQGFARVHVIQRDVHDLVVTCTERGFGPTHHRLPPYGTLDAAIPEHPAFILRMQSNIPNNMTASKRRSKLHLRQALFKCCASRRNRIWNALWVLAARLQH